jgi:hypothetical protein
MSRDHLVEQSGAYYSRVTAQRGVQLPDGHENPWGDADRQKTEE